MEWLWYVATIMFLLNVFTLPLIAVMFMWQVVKEEVEEEAVEDRKPQQCEHCSCDDMFAPDLGGDHG